MKLKIDNIDSKLRYSSEEFKSLNNNIEYFFGEKYNYINSIKRYEHYLVFQQHKPIYNVEDIGEVFNEDIYRLIRNEEYYQDKAKRLQEEFKEYAQMEEIPEDKIIYFAQELGLYPIQNEPIYKRMAPYNTLTNEEFMKLVMECLPFRQYNVDSLYSNLIPFYLMTEEEIEEYKEKFHNDIQRKKFLFHYLFDDMLNNFLHTLEDGRVCVEFGYSHCFCRGENAFYGSSKAGLYRKGKIDNIDKLICIMKMYEMYRFYCMLNSQQVGIGIYGSALAQHYGIATHCIDITSDIKVALFFACCKYDKEKKKYFPLTEEDFKYRNSRKHIAELGGDSRYGIIYKVPADLVKMSNILPDGPYKKVHSIGYQPFLRSENQKGYLLETDEHYNMYTDLSFEKYKFRLNEEICNWIYKEMDCGNKLFPQEAFNDIDDIVADIDKLEEYDVTTLVNVFNEYKVLFNYVDINTLIKILRKKGHKCCNNKQWCSQERLKELQDKWKDKFNMEKFINCLSRLVFTL